MPVLFERILALVFELTGFKVPRLRFHYVRGEIQHILGDFLLGNVVKIVRLGAHFVCIAA